MWWRGGRDRWLDRFITDAMGQLSIKSRRNGEDCGGRERVGKVTKTECQLVGGSVVTERGKERQ